MSYQQPPFHKKWEMPPTEALRAAYPDVAATFDAIGESDSGRMNAGKSADAIAAARMLAAEDDDGEACLDDARDSLNGDEFAWTPETEAARRAWLKDAMPCGDADSALFGLREEWEPDAARQVADTRCAGCREGEDLILLLSGMDDAMIAYADRMLGDDDVWRQLRAVRQAMAEAL
jgi:hypothetical protein